MGRELGAQKGKCSCMLRHSQNLETIRNCHGINYAKRHVECSGVSLMNLEVVYYTHLLRGLKSKGWHCTLRLRGQGMTPKLSSTIIASKKMP